MRFYTHAVDSVTCDAEPTILYPHWIIYTSVITDLHAVVYFIYSANEFKTINAFKPSLVNSSSPLQNSAPLNRLVNGKLQYKSVPSYLSPFGASHFTLAIQDKRSMQTSSLLEKCLTFWKSSLFWTRKLYGSSLTGTIGVCMLICSHVPSHSEQRLYLFIPSSIKHKLNIGFLVKYKTTALPWQLKFFKQSFQTFQCLQAIKARERHHCLLAVLWK